MKPAAQLLALTIGQGLSVGLMTGLAFLASLGVLTRPQALWVLAAALLGALIGGIASLFHMHQFSAARYILRRLRTSWLSREALTTGLYGAALFFLTLGTVVGHPYLNSATYVTLTWVVAGFGLVAMFVTAMLYATIPAMMSWHSPVTALNFGSVGLLSGLCWLVFFAAVNGARRPSLAIAVLILLVVVAVVKAFQWHGFRLARSRLSAATGFGFPRAPYRLQDTGTTKPPYKTQTQIHPRIAAGVRLKMAVGTGVCLAGVPLVVTVLWVTQGGWGYALTLALSVTAGTISERWLFFADATHSSRVFFEDEGAEPSRVASRTPRAR